MFINNCLELKWQSLVTRLAEGRFALNLTQSLSRSLCCIRHAKFKRDIKGTYLSNRIITANGKGQMQWPQYINLLSKKSH